MVLLVRLATGLSAASTVGHVREGGIRVAAWFRDQDLDDVAVESLSVRFVSQPPRRGLAFGVGRIDAARIPEAITRLTQVLRDR